MVCEKCKAAVNWFSEDFVQGWRCPDCGWSLVTTNIDRIYEDITEYSIYITNVNAVNKNMIKTVAGIAGVNFLRARNMLMERHACIFKDKAPKVKIVMEELVQLKIQFEVIPEFPY